MITAVTGNPGEGKTAWIVRFIIIPALLTSTRQVCTNIKIEIDKLKEYMEEMGGEFDADQLICFPYVQAADECEDGEKPVAEFEFTKVLPFVTCHEEDISEYSDVSLYKHATSDQEGFFTVYRRYKEKAIYDPSEFWKSCPTGALVIIDEAAKYLNAYVFGANSLGKLLGKYSMIHRHQGHDVYFGIQNLKHLASQSRDLVAQQIKLYNYHQHPVLGLKFNVFLIRSYDIGLLASVKATKVEWRRYDVKIFNLYDTHQFDGSVNTLSAQSFISKKLVKVTTFQRFKNYLFGNPFLVGVTLAIITIFFGLYNLFGDIGGKLDGASAKKTKAVKPNLKKENEIKNDDSLESVVSEPTRSGYAEPVATSPALGTIAERQTPQRETVNRFGAINARGYELSNASNASE